jgi:hypothetical protein
MLLAAAFGDWRDAGIFLKLRGARVALPLFTEGDKQSGSEGGAGPGEGAKEWVVRQRLTDRTDLGIEARDGAESNAQLFDESLNQESIRRDDGDILREWRGAFHDA